jgi:RimJ/RimL family protein N-acetyltransferase
MSAHKLPDLHGMRVTLRQPLPSDVAVRLGLGNDPDILEMYGVSRDNVAPLTQASVERWVQNMSEHPHAWVIESGTLIGEARLDKVDFQDKRASFAIGIFDLNALGQGFGTEATMLVLDYAFNTLKLHRVYLRVAAFNHRAIRSYKKCGFKIEGRERESCFVNNSWYDDLIMGILEHEFAGLDVKQHNDLSDELREWDALEPIGREVI